MRSLKKGMVGLSLVGAVFGAPQAANAVASFDIEASAFIQARKVVTGGTTSQDGTYSGNSTVTSYAKISSGSGVGAGDDIVGNPNLGSYVTRGTDIGDTTSSYTDNFTYVRPSWFAVPPSGSPFTYAGTWFNVAGSASASGANPAQLDAEVANTNVGVTYFNNNVTHTRTIDVAFAYSLSILALVDDAALEDVTANVSFVVETRTAPADSSEFSAWSELYSTEFVYDPENGEFELGSLGEEAFFYTMALAPRTSQEFNLRIVTQGSASSGVPPTVPVPAALPLLGLGLGAIGLVGWRRRAA